MKRRLFTILSAMSLTLCVATGGVWIGSQGMWHAFGYYFARGNSAVEIMASPETIFLSVISLPDKQQPATRFSFIHTTRPDHTVAFDEIPLGYLTNMLVYNEPEAINAARGGSRFRWWHKPGTTVLCIGVPPWALSFTFAIAPIIWCVTRFRRRSAGRCNLCIACGYDLRATPGRCPECGTSPKKFSIST